MEFTYMMQIINALHLFYKKYLSMVCEFVTLNISVPLAIAYVQIFYGWFGLLNIK